MNICHMRSRKWGRCSFCFYCLCLKTPHSIKLLLSVPSVFSVLSPPRYALDTISPFLANNNLCISENVWRAYEARYLAHLRTLGEIPRCGLTNHATCPLWAWRLGGALYFIEKTRNMWKLPGTLYWTILPPRVVSLQALASRKGQRERRSVH